MYARGRGVVHMQRMILLIGDGGSARQNPIAAMEVSDVACIRN